MPAENSNWTLRHRIDELDAKQDKRLQELEQFVEDIKPWIGLLGFYKDSARNEHPCIIGRVFPKAGTIDAIIFDSGASGGTEQITASYGDGPNQIRRLLSPKKEVIEDTSNELVAASAG
jgi:hypothetical protein